MTLSRPKLIFIAPAKSSFVLSDIAILSDKYQVIQGQYNWYKKEYLILNLIRQLFLLIFNLGSSKKVVVSFAGYWSVLPTFLGKLFKTPVYIILHGTECANLPEFNYGSLRKKWLRAAIGYSLNNATKLLPVSSSLISTKTVLSSGKTSNQGFMHHFHSLNTPYQVIHNALDGEYWQQKESENKVRKNVCAVFSEAQFILKGGDIILEAAKLLPSYNFLIAGMTAQTLTVDVPDNVRFLGKLSREELRNVFLSSIYHVQISAYEGFGLALCEAMLCGCIPIVSAANILPEIVGETGFVLEERTSEGLITAIRSAENQTNQAERSILARNRILDNYNIEIRAVNLLDALKE